MQDSIIGYLLGALDKDELAQFEAQLEIDPDLQAKVRDAARSLLILRRDDDDIEPPQGLTESTCAMVEAAIQGGEVSLRPNRFEVGAHDDSWTLVDVMVACSVLLAACMLFFPAVNNSRYHAQIAGCQNNLRSIGQALIEYSGADPQGLFPRVPETGNMAVAGMYAPTLMSLGFIDNDHNFYCPSSSAAATPRSCSIPCVEEIKRATGETLQVMQLKMGGHYGYTLGVIQNGRLNGIRNRSRNHFALMSDSPAVLETQRETKRAKSSVHRNLLFESGRVRGVCPDTTCWSGDQLYTNDLGVVSAGVHEGDAVIGASNAVPVLRVSYEK